MSNAPTTCKVCESSGLALLFTWHSAIATDTALAPIGASALSSHTTSAKALGLPDLQYARYVLRTLRPGYLHVYHEKAPVRLAKKVSAKDPEAGNWEIFRVAPGGALYPEDHPDFSTAAQFSCSQDGGSHIFTAMAYRLPDAHSSGKLWVAFSANLWTPELRGKNKKKQEVMQCVDVPALLGGASSATYISAKADWIEKNIAEFALGSFDQGGITPAFPFVSRRGQGAKIEARFNVLDSKHSQTKGRSAVIVLRDPVGTAASLAHIGASRHFQAKEYAWTQRHPLGAARSIDFIRDSVYQSQVQEIQKTTRPLLVTDVYDAQGKPLVSETERKFMPKPEEISEWRYIGVMGSQIFYDSKNLYKDIPQSARWLQLNAQPMDGIVIAPAADTAAARTEIATRKINRLHDREAVKKFKEQFQTELNAYNDKITQHGSDHALLINHPPIKAYFDKHFDPADPNRPQQFCKPGLIYLEEATRALIGWGGITPGMEATIRTLLEAKVDSPEGWAWRAVVGNQQGLFSTLDSFLSQQYDWFTNPDNKLDKSYDTLKALLADEDASKILTAKFGWLNKSGIGLSFGMMGFLGGAASHIAAQSISRDFPDEVAKAAQVGAKIEKTTRKFAEVMSKGVAGIELKLAAKVQTWCLNQSIVLEALLNKKPPARPLYVRVDVTLPQALEILVDFRKQKADFNRTTRKMLKELEGLQALDGKQTVSLDFLTTDVALDDAKNIKGLAGEADRVRVSVLSHTAGVPVAALSLQQLGEVYRKAHRYDGLKAGLTALLGESTPAAVRAATSVVAGAVNVPAAALRGATQFNGQLSLFGAWLQWRLHVKNEEKLEELNRRLAERKDLTQGQREAIEDAILITRLGNYDNWCGIAGGTLEMVGVGAAELRLAGTASALTALAAFAGAGGAFMNAAQNFKKAQGKSNGLERAYNLVGVLYVSAGFALGAAGVEVATHWFLERKLLEVGLRVATRDAAGRAIATRFGYGLAIRGGLSLTGVGLVVTVAAFAIEGLVAYYDRTKLEAWVENCYFGNYPKWRAQSRPTDGRRYAGWARMLPEKAIEDPALWDSEAKAFSLALEEANDQGAAS
ncbi:T6SS effector BTH_I2691 family protein [Viridibacterium curvum]|uniref:Toxin VasX N-terminal region domain-containing protein n=1 Tax=Viridibacterium curvum TaxID=1101404 RepID=A0ABP9R868_9RHOO